ncbi:carboxylating nicotinate-nucleotide diphosphorylase [Biformimicrobium ophioploci]|uniref:nicotinate-nucleotide diphosphorylase (carboxylating) n=1 Tax=Biformimicrobium ophioploci TaxID=3036711 RepID=A0ABQ6LXK4_9GAMM|nr:carboxylating nicotinate-nucleotide diphosphorylase [Microbulbifer sp. NKW57]GMG86809.1 carboxylating nicotinate-nucleotide diphosphorylase [Microbulbifer sp. NKW57]
MNLDDAKIPGLRADLERTVRDALAEDIGSGDITAQLIPADRSASARVITREDCTICGTEWVNEVFRQLDPALQVNWMVADGDRAAADSVLFTLHGNARSILTGERTALNFLQTLSGTATAASALAEEVRGGQIRVLDTRKTIPGLRTAQKYAVLCGGCHNHRIGLYDAFLIKENHIAAAGGIDAAVEQARQLAPQAPVEVEVENLDELRQALDAGADIIMLDEFNERDTLEALQLAKGTAKIEISGSVDAARLRQLSGLAVDYISSGALTKHLKAVDLSLRLQM